MVKIILDTNLLIYAFQNRVDLVNELRRVIGEGFQICVPKAVFSELKRLNQPSASLALAFLDKENVTTFDSGDYADSAILAYAKNEGAYVATNDAGLKKLLNAAKIRTITLRDGNHLAFV